MNIKAIKNRANELFQRCKPQYTRILFLMLLIGLIPTIISLILNNDLIDFIVTIVFITFSHGYIVSSLKIVRNNDISLRDDDAWVGFTRIKELLPTYLLVDLFSYGMIIVVSLVLSFVLVANSENIIYSLINAINNSDVTSIIYILQSSTSFILSGILIIVIIAVISVVISLYTYATPYLLEKYQMTNTKAIKESFKFIKGHVIDLLKLELSFIGWMILAGVVTGLVGNVLSYILGTSLSSIVGTIVGGVVGIYTYLPQYYLSQAIFFEEIAYRRYSEQTQDYFTQGETDVY